MNRIIALSGKKNSGKNTLSKSILDYYIKHFVEPNNWTKYAAPNYLLECSFADALKCFCIDVLGLKYEQCYGTEDEKNLPTTYLWENASPFLAWKFGTRTIKDYGFELNYKDIDSSEKLKSIFYKYIDNNRYVHLGSKTGPMSGRDIMQILGTDLIRETFGNVWVTATLRKIKQYNKELSIITDLRFPNEAEALLQLDNAFIIRLTRAPFGKLDNHPSECSLDDFNWNREKCFVLDNANMDEDEQNNQICPILDRIFKSN